MCTLRERIILIDNNLERRNDLACYLTGHGLEVIVEAYTSPALSSLFHQYPADLILLDLTRPQLSGLRLCAEIRKTIDTPLLFTSSHNEDDLKIEALRTGGDDYISRPCSPDVLLARMKAHIRRHRRAFPMHQRHLLLYPGLEVDLLARRVLTSGKEVTLSSKEFGILSLLANNPNRIYAAEALYELLWRDNRLSGLRTVMVHIYTLRQKIEDDPREPRYIHTVRGAGYKFTSPHMRQDIAAPAIASRLP
ncbi:MULTISPECIES: response regulator transcription factor [Paenibacillus]|uniref:response regulator transcription factor n=1 Tax=Paenibacillus TaxID=44249 RepID=UPI0022B88EF9|nr:response regulator transcription factor [Paenibacillus caseinilyticus]MCZ8521035.1 response regulator transcription factor [Paenibacillus caseinilyticus]